MNHPFEIVVFPVDDNGNLKISEDIALCESERDAALAVSEYARSGLKSRCFRLIEIDCALPNANQKSLI